MTNAEGFSLKEVIGCLSKPHGERGAVRLISNIEKGKIAGKGKTTLVAGASGFIGGHLVKFLLGKRRRVRAVDIREPDDIDPRTDEMLILDLRDRANCLRVTEGVDEVYQFAAETDGMGCLPEAHSKLLFDNVQIDSNMLEAARVNGVKRFFYPSCADVYPIYLQKNARMPGLREDDAFPALPSNESGMEKLYAEKLCLSYHDDYGMKCRIGRLFDIYGPFCDWKYGQEQAPAAICRKVAEASEGDEISIWGDGEQSRSFCYIDDCLNGIWKLMRSNYHMPLNIGSDEIVSINRLTDMVAGVAGKNIKKKHLYDRAPGVRGRYADCWQLQSALGWSPDIGLEEGMKKTYAWIESQVKSESRVKS